MKLSIVTTLYNSESWIIEFYKRAIAEAEIFAKNDFELIFVNDGSPDNSESVINKLAQNDKRVVAINLSRNFGHQQAMLTGLSESTGDLIFLIDSDLEEDPAWLSAFHQKLVGEELDLVYGQQTFRKGGFSERLLGNIYYGVFRFLTGINIAKNAVTACLMTRSFLNSLLLHNEREFFMGGLYYLTGYKQSSLFVNKLSISPTTYSFKRKIKLAINSISSISQRPLVSVFYLGSSIFLLALLAIIYLVILWFMDKPPNGWASAIVSIWFFGGLIICILGVIGIYISKIFIEVKHRPIAIIKDTYRLNVNKNAK